MNTRATHLVQYLLALFLKRGFKMPHYEKLRMLLLVMVRNAGVVQSSFSSLIFSVFITVFISALFALQLNTIWWCSYAS